MIWMTPNRSFFDFEYIQFAKMCLRMGADNHFCSYISILLLLANDGRGRKTATNTFRKVCDVDEKYSYLRWFAHTKNYTKNLKKAKR